MDKFVSYSQNFITDPNLVKALIKKSNLAISDTVLEIGAGKGIITTELSKACKKVIAVEIDKNLYDFLSSNLKSSNITLINEDILKVNLPNEGFKVFSNIPFNYTSRIIDRLYFENNSPQSAYLIMQKEVGDIYLGLPRETQNALLLKPFFEIKVFYKFNKKDFKPAPFIDIIMLHIDKLEIPLIEETNKDNYFDFVVYGTTQCKTTLKENLSKIFTSEQFKRLAKNLDFSVTTRPLDITYIQWVELFKYYQEFVIEGKKALVKDSYNKQKLEQSKLKKVYKTWRHSY